MKTNFFVSLSSPTQPVQLVVLIVRERKCFCGEGARSERQKREKIVFSPFSALLRNSSASVRALMTHQLRRLTDTAPHKCQFIQFVHDLEISGMKTAIIRYTCGLSIDCRTGKTSKRIFHKFLPFTRQQIEDGSLRIQKMFVDSKLNSGPLFLIVVLIYQEKSKRRL